EHGPATIVNVFGPTVPCANLITVSSGFISRLASLYGLVTRMASSTPSSTAKSDLSTAPVLAVIPMAVRVAPGLTCAGKPHGCMLPQETNSPLAFLPRRAGEAASPDHRFRPWRESPSRSGVVRHTSFLARPLSQSFALVQTAPL